MAVTPRVRLHLSIKPPAASVKAYDAPAGFSRLISGRRDQSKAADARLLPPQNPAENGYVNGYGDGRFGVDDRVTRAQLAAIFHRSAGSPAASGTTRSDGRFDPQTPATRAEVVSALYQYRRLSSGEAPAPAPAPDQGGKILVAYFSDTNNTENVAKHLEAILGADLYQITPEAPYTAADLNYNDSGCRANREQDDNSARPAISGSVENLADYDVVFLGYPIWWGQAPKILYSFLEGRRFSGGASRETVESWVNSLELPAAASPAAEG